MVNIKFGTSGWRAIIGDEFTYDNVKLVSQAIADYINGRGSASEKRSVLVGYDPRFLSEEFAKLSSCVLAANNIKALYTVRDVPTPLISYEIIRGKLAGGINFTASHNPPEYNGLKFSPDSGGPAMPETTKAIEESCKILQNDRSKIKEISWEEGLKKKLIEEIDPKPVYIKRIKELVDFKAVKKAKLKVGIDLLYGAARGYLDTLLKETGCKLEVIHDYRDPLFGGGRPEPDAQRLEGLSKIVTKNKLNLGLSCDGDADRFGILDCDGTYITPNEVIALLLYSLAKSRNWKGIVARSCMTTHLIDAIAKKFGIEVKETPVGFKYIGDIMVNRPKEFIIGGEESGGLTIRGHVPEKDGILACLLMAEMAAIEKKSFKKIFADIEKLVGKFITTRKNLTVKPEIMTKFKDSIQAKAPKEFAGIKVKELNTLDGFKFILEDGSWVGMRLSGTEPLVRLYFESNSQQKIETIQKDTEKIIAAL
ncbi:MAG: phosphoglucomutase/phosphomannomutase family protein [Elusimicrobia bacterium]|nr:phosphoglucomutase/phosphomannomutase family protein [Elusimicrobiota bacterium]MBU2614458.1 phosphoglucomutase/phosphomannomutase family protein [Elusimicrobiota bacterium]